MFGAILGDIIGSPYEFTSFNIKTKEFPLFSERSQFTDDTVMTLAVARAMLNQAYRLNGSIEEKPYTEEEMKNELVKSMQDLGLRYPDSGYGQRFGIWLTRENPQPYGSYGNGSAMRVSSVGWLFDNLDTIRYYARLSAEVTHNHPEGIKGAEAIASAIYLARTNHNKKEIKEYIEKEFGYDLTRTCDEIRPNYTHVETCQETVPEALTAFFEGESFEDVIRTGVSLGGDSDTLTCIAGSVAEAYYPIPEEYRNEVKNRLPGDLWEILDEFNHYLDR